MSRELVQDFLVTLTFGKKCNIFYPYFYIFVFKMKGGINIFSTVKTIGLNGIDGYIINVESTLLPGLSGIDIVGLPDLSVKEAKERVISAMLLKI